MRPLPSLPELLVLSLAVYRATRFVGWDDWPPIAKVRAWVIGEHWLMPTWRHNQLVGASMFDSVLTALADAEENPAMVRLPGKAPVSEVEHVRPGYDRPLLAHFFHCPFCLGAWIAIVAYVIWLWFPHAVMYAAAPAAIAGAASLLAKNLDK